MRCIRLTLVVAALVLLPSLAFGIGFNDGVSATASLNVRATPSTNGTVLATVPTGTIGIIVGGPTAANGYTWWQIQWGSPYVRGWSAQNYLAVLPPNASVYSDFLGPGWRDTLWLNTTKNYASGTKRNGTCGIQVVTSAAWARLYMSSNGFATGGYQTLRLSLMNGGGSGQLLYLGLYDTNGNAIRYVQAWDYVTGGTLSSGTWYDLIIPLADLAGQNRTVGGVVIEVGAATTFYADDVSFSTVSGSTRWIAPTITSVAASCAPTSIQAGQTSQCAATVQGTGTFNSAVTWSMTAGAINASGLYTAPGTVSGTTAVTITARSVQDTTKAGTAAITVTPPPQPQISQASDVVFGDALGTGWVVGSWDGVTVDAASDVAYRGDYGMKVAIANIQYGRLQLKTAQNYKFATSSYDAISFVLNIGTYESEDLYVGLLDASGYAIRYIRLMQHVPAGVLDAYRWQPFRIPFSDLGVSGTDVYGVEIQSIYPSTFFVDEVKFQPKGGCNVQ